MVFRLTDAELRNSFEAIEHHGYSGLIPEPLEWRTVRERWVDLSPKIASLDLDDYKPYAPIRLFAPKSRANVRPVYLLHPIDLLIYTALTLIVRDDLEAIRLPVRRRQVFSYRANGAASNRLYDSSITYSDFREGVRRRTQRGTTRFIAVADIADFFPRIYQHRVQNVIEASATTMRAEDVARVLGKFISNLLGRNSYGIPIGPFASRILAEAVLTDVDSALESERVDFVRWVDDYCIFCSSETDAQQVLFRLAERLFSNHGLTLSTAKTKILSKEDFVARFLRDPEHELRDDLSVLARLNARFDPYSEDEMELSQEEVDALERIDFGSLLEEALADASLVDYERLSAVLRHEAVLEKLSQEDRNDIANVLLSNLEHLYPIAEEVSRFFQTFSASSKRVRSKIARKLVNSIKSYRGKWPPEYHIIWTLHVFASSSEWGRWPEILSIFQTHPSDAVRRFAALALHVNGARPDAVALKAAYGNASPLTRLAILLASQNLGKDERKHWRNTLQLTGPLEKLL